MLIINIFTLLYQITGRENFLITQIYIGFTVSKLSEGLYLESALFIDINKCFVCITVTERMGFGLLKPVFSIVQYAIAYTISSAVQFNSVYRLAITKQYSTTLTVYYSILVPLQYIKYNGGECEKFALSKAAEVVQTVQT